ncbi:MAG: hypothetical protein AAFP86_20820 [Planctomycetota bacterium]
MKTLCAYALAALAPVAALASPSPLDDCGTCNFSINGSVTNNPTFNPCFTEIEVTLSGTDGLCSLVGDDCEGSCTVTGTVRVSSFCSGVAGAMINTTILPDAVPYGPSGGMQTAYTISGPLASGTGVGINLGVVDITGRVASAGFNVSCSDCE